MHVVQQHTQLGMTTLSPRGRGRVGGVIRGRRLCPLKLAGLLGLTWIGLLASWWSGWWHGWWASTAATAAAGQLLPAVYAANQLHFAAVGDWGVPLAPYEVKKLGMLGNQQRVAMALREWSDAVAAAPDSSFVLSLGDHAYPVGLRGANETSRLTVGWDSHQRDCHSAAPPLPSVGVSIGMERGCHQNYSLADG